MKFPRQCSKIGIQQKNKKAITNPQEMDFIQIKNKGPQNKV